MICELCGMETAEFVAREQGSPNREIIMCRTCRRRTKNFYKEPMWKVEYIRKAKVI